MTSPDPTTPNDLAPVVIAVAPNGGRRSKADHRALPLTPDELAETAAGCLETGACMIHTHVHDKDGRHLLDAEAYRAAIAAIRAAVGDRLVVQITTEALGVYRPAEQTEVVRKVRPEAVSLALRELLPDESHEAGFAQFLGWLRREKIVPQIILYTPEEAVSLAALKARGLIPFDNIPVLYVLGRYTAEQRSAPTDLLPFLAPGMPCFAHWSVCAFGSRETACVTAGALLGGHVRVGFENNLWLPDGSLAPDNAALIATSHAALRACGLAIADADRLRHTWSASW
ncbi:3-keto-5-aminohexanoate cleavage protein [Sinorhizobium numidicum]|uniref:3-keto-5-aminohexanoate cleavage protein n=1 Tax=Sinorhizobium numidicum TaxID=680248 RepID=A0ABY8CMS1_9HYPH|nr:3-keto-5-aminohexanoate cleavage protein [Sinorhizobium numidicum]WEX73979.1 3-keto-5-aminohexanoate cleavage protein [Sinorhizobium numidicum]WEX79964.1 3-keto-5-aminohexanoate cleavage protein [Sinorhizobium numidicum]